MTIKKYSCWVVLIIGFGFSLLMFPLYLNKNDQTLAASPAVFFYSKEQQQSLFQHLSDAIQYKTISSSFEQINFDKEFIGFNKYLEETFPSAIGSNSCLPILVKSKC